MDTIKLTEKKGTRLIAHRGLSGIERENTLPAFVAAGNRTYYGEECDVHVTADGKYVVYHESETERLCDENILLEQSTLAKIRSLKLLKSGEEKVFDQTLIIPTLEEYLAVVKRYDKVAVIELKGLMRAENIAEIVEICRDAYAWEKIVFISFFFENLVEIRKLLPDQPLQFLTCEPPEDLAERLTRYHIDLDIGYWLLTEEFVRTMHENGIRVNCWTCDDPVKAQELIEWGVDYITTNILE